MVHKKYINIAYSKNLNILFSSLINKLYPNYKLNIPEILTILNKTSEILFSLSLLKTLATIYTKNLLQ